MRDTTAISEEVFKPRKLKTLHVETCKKCGGLCANYGSDGWMCSSCWASCCGPSDSTDEEEEEEEDEYSGLALSKKDIASLKRERRKEERKQAIENKKYEARTKKEKKLLKEILSKPITKTRNLQLQKILQNQEHDHGKHARAMLALQCLDKEFDRYKHEETDKHDDEYLNRLRFLKTVSYRAGDIYEYKWD